MAYERRGRHAYIENGSRKRGPMGPRRRASPLESSSAVAEGGWEPDVYQRWCIRFLAEQNGATIGQLRRIFGVYRSDIVNFVGELEDEEVAESKEFIIGEDVWVSLTSYGTKLSGTGYQRKSPHYRSLPHWSAINDARIYVERYFRNVEWTCERRLRSERGGKRRGYLPDAVAVCDGLTEEGQKRRIRCAIEVELSAKTGYDWHGHIASNEKKFDLVIYFATPEICRKFRLLKFKQKHPKLKVVEISAVNRRLNQAKWRLPGDPEPLDRWTNKRLELEKPLTELELRIVDLILEQGLMPMDQLEAFLDIGRVEAGRLIDSLVQARVLERAKPLAYEPPWLWASNRGASASSTGLAAFIPSLGNLERARAINEIRYRYTHGKQDVEWISGRTLTEQHVGKGWAPAGAIKRRRKVKTEKGIVMRTEVCACDLFLFIPTRKRMEVRMARRFGEGYSAQRWFYSQKSRSTIRKFVRERSAAKRKRLEDLPMPNSEYLLMSPRPNRRKGSKPRRPSPADLWNTLASKPPARLRRMVMEAVERDALKGIAMAAKIKKLPEVREAWTQTNSRGARVCWLVTDVGFFRVAHGGWGTTVDEVMRKDVFIKEDGPPVDPRKKRRKPRGQQHRPTKFQMKDEVWKVVAPFVPRYKPKGKRSKRPISERAVLSGAIWRLRYDASWETIPTNLGYGHGHVIRARIREWEAMGFWEKIWTTLRDELPDGEELEWWRLESNEMRRRPDAPPPVGFKKTSLQKPRRSYVRKMVEPSRFEMKDHVWEQVEDVLAEVEKRRVKPFGYWISDRAALSGVLWRLRKKATWKDLKVSLGFGNSEVVRSRLREWEALGVWDEIREILQVELKDGNKLHWWAIEPLRGAHARKSPVALSSTKEDRPKERRGYRPPKPRVVPLVEKFNQRERVLLRKLQEEPDYRFTFADYRRVMRVGRQPARNDIVHLTDEWLLVGRRLGKTFTFSAPKDLSVRLQRLQEMEGSQD